MLDSIARSTTNLNAVMYAFCLALQGTDVSHSSCPDLGRTRSGRTCVLVRMLRTQPEANAG
jgi:hypothetical protein